MASLWLETEAVESSSALDLQPREDSRLVRRCQLTCMLGDVVGGRWSTWRRPKQTEEDMKTERKAPGSQTQSTRENRCSTLAALLSLYPQGSRHRFYRLHLTFDPECCFFFPSHTFFFELRHLVSSSPGQILCNQSGCLLLFGAGARRLKIFRQSGNNTPSPPFTINISTQIWERRGKTCRSCHREHHSQLSRITGIC